MDGRRSYFEWINAGHYVCSGSRGAMSMVTQGYVSDLYFGFDPERLLLRLDSRGGPFRSWPSPGIRLVSQPRASN